MKYTKLNPSKSTGLKMSKKKRKFRVMTNAEFCNKHKYCNACPEYKGDMNRCYWFMHGIANIEPYRTTNGKYILIEVKNNGRK